MRLSEARRILGERRLETLEPDEIARMRVAYLNRSLPRKQGDASLIRKGWMEKAPNSTASDPRVRASRWAYHRRTKKPVLFIFHADKGMEVNPLWRAK